MDMLAEYSFEEQIEILKVSSRTNRLTWTNLRQLIEQQLAIRIELRSRLAPTKAHDVLFAATPLRKAIKEAAPLSILHLPDGIEQQAAAVRLKLDELEGKQSNLIGINQRCEKLIEAVEMAREYVNQGSGFDREGEHSSTSADLDVLIDEASAIVELCTNFKALYGTPAPLRTEPLRGWAASSAQHSMEPPRPAIPGVTGWGHTWSDHAGDKVMYAEDAAGNAENGSVCSEAERLDAGDDDDTWGNGPARSW